MRAFAFAALLSMLAVAGCLSSDSGAGDDDQGEDMGPIPTVSAQRLPDPDKDDAWSTVIVGDHGAPEMHHIRELHTGLHDGIGLVGWDPLTDHMPIGAVGTGWGAAGLWETYVCVAQFAGTGAIAIVDISDPASPTVVSQVDDPLVNGDCQFSADGKHMFAGAYLAGYEYPDMPQEFPLCDRGCPAGGGINVWDVSDKANPEHILYTNTGTYHTLMVHTDPDTNQTYVIQAYAGTIYHFDPDGPTLTEVFVQQPMEHDMWVAKHPITGQQLLYTGADDGFVIYDFDDPSTPRELATWQPDGDPVTQEASERGGCCAWHRQATVDELIDGRAIAVVAGETCGTGNTLPYVVMDVTDPAAPKALSMWEIPGKPVSTDARHLCEMSPHEFAVYDGYVATGNYHAGVWVFDIGSAERLLDPVTLGYYVPAEEPLVRDPVFGAQDLTFPWNPFVWGAFFDERGYIVAGDFSSGVYVLELPGVSGVAKPG